MRVTVGTRGSPLAMTQTEGVLRVLRQRNPRVEFVVREVRTQGDMKPHAPLTSLPRGLFAKELESALAAGEIDMAVHSFKDLPTDLAEGFAIAAISEREDPRDVLVTPDRRTLLELPPGSRIGTGAPRRIAQLRAYRPDLEIVPIRGNVGTRIKKALGPDLEGVVLAAAGIRRLGLEEHIAEYLGFNVSLPAVGQGALAVEVRAGDERMAEIASAVDHKETRIAVTAEMGVLHRLGGGCRTPIAAYGDVRWNAVRLEALVAAADGSRIVRAVDMGQASQAAELGRQVAETLLERGAGPLLSA